jgi:hypothetical protein
VDSCPQLAINSGSVNQLWQQLPLFLQVLDDPKLLKKSLRSEEKRKEHSAKKW